ncbi:hypothetical protein YC2023_116226 [Brassica napus]
MINSGFLECGSYRKLRNCFLTSAKNLGLIMLLGLLIEECEACLTFIYGIELKGKTAGVDID